MKIAHKLEKLAQIATTPLQRSIIMHGYLQTKATGEFTQRQIASRAHRQISTRAQQERVWSALRHLTSNEVVEIIAKRKIQGAENMHKNIYALSAEHPVVDLILLTTQAMIQLGDRYESLWSASTGGGYTPEKGNFRFAIKPLYICAMYGISPGMLDHPIDQNVVPRTRTSTEIGEKFGEQRKGVNQAHLEKLVDAKLLFKNQVPRYRPKIDVYKELHSRPLKYKGKLMQNIEELLVRNPDIRKSDSWSVEEFKRQGISAKDLSRFAREHPEMIQREETFTHEKKYEITRNGKFYFHNVIIPLIDIIQGQKKGISEKVRTSSYQDIRILERYMFLNC